MDVLKGIIPRDYQKEIANKCLQKNCLVVLPTGMGKTLIALLVSIERIKKFPLEKILILAPTKPLVEQHFKSFKEKLPPLWADMEMFHGGINPTQRKKLWNTSTIVFSTPQCIANDLKKRLYSLEEVSLLVEDEAHRCVKNYDYNFIANKYRSQAKNFRILGLTASPGSDSEKIKEICKNLYIDSVELRTRDSEDVKPHIKELVFRKREVNLPIEFLEIKEILNSLYGEYIDKLKEKNFLKKQVSKISLIKAQKGISMQISRGDFSPFLYVAASYCAQAIKLSHAIELLETQSLLGLSKYFNSLYSQASEKKSKGVIQLVSKNKFNYCYAKINELISKKQEHPKIQETIDIIFEEKKVNASMKAIIFTQFRETAAIISERLNHLEDVKSKVFVGQAKKEGRGLSQKEQKKIIDEFRENKINVLCATCIAEEGLDIPEVDTVIFYEPVSSAIRSIQRRGRTARLQKGKLFILVTKNTKDEIAYYSSISREKRMSKIIEKMKQEIENSSKKSVQSKLFK